MPTRSFSGRSLNSKFRLLLPLLLLAVWSGVGWAEEHGDTRVEIIVDPPAGRAPLRAYLKPNFINLKGPACFRWSFGDGTESTKRTPGFHLFPGGTYDVILEVVDANGKQYTAGFSVKAALSG